MSAALKDELVHGKITTYTYYRCRCAECRDAKRQDYAAYRARTGNRSGKFQSKARHHALDRLAKAHPDEFQRYFTEEKAALRQERGEPRTA